MANVYGVFLASVTDQLPELMALLGDDWLLLRTRLVEEVTVAFTNLETVPLAESRVATIILEVANNGPADAFVKRLMEKASATANRASGEGGLGRRVRGGRRQPTTRTTEARPPDAITNLVKQMDSIAQTKMPVASVPSAREITVTSHTLAGQPTSRFVPREMYRLRFSVNFPTDLNLGSGNTAISDIPKGGLKTRWVVTSTDVELSVSETTCSVEKVRNTWVAGFDLDIPESGPSETKEIRFVSNEGDGHLLVTIYAVGPRNTRELYREITVRLAGGPTVTVDETSKAAIQTNLTTPHEWTTPPVHIQVSIKNGVADVSTKRFQLEIYEFVEPFNASVAVIANAINNVHESLERFREIHSDYLEDLDHADMVARLSSDRWKPYSWDAQPNSEAQKFRSAFARVQSSIEWRNLAHDGYALFDQCFPEGTKLRTLLARTLPPGSRIDFHWNAQSGPGFVPHVPWALMHVKEVNVTGVDLARPTDFLGLRFRVSARSWSVQNGSVVLGHPRLASSVNILYWGRQPGDDVGTEAEWQSLELSQLKTTKVLPEIGAPNLKEQVVQAIDMPSPVPVAILYFYCHCSVGDGGQPCLRFGSTSKSQDVLTRNDLSQRRIPDGPLVFANACTTSQADPYLTSFLEQTFFDRGVRAFIGTEAKVPIKLASKFAWLFFQFFSRRVDPEPMAAGEALAQSRLFLWTQYQNLGGLFYSMSNQYDLYFASSEEILALRGSEK